MWRVTAAGDVFAWSKWDLGDPSGQLHRTRLPPHPASPEIVEVYTSKLARSATPWAPDGASFCYVTADGAVHIHWLDQTDLSRSGRDVLVAADACAAFWSPC